MKTIKVPFNPMVFPISSEEAIKRLTDDEKVDALFQVGDNTYIYSFMRAEVVEMLKKSNSIEESGLIGQRMDMGIFVHMATPKDFALGMMFLKTKPSARISDDIIMEREKQRSIAIGQGVEGHIRHRTHPGAN